jgi:hypothetical protein
MGGSRVLLYGMALVAAAVAAGITMAPIPIFIIPVLVYVISFGCSIATKYAACDSVAVGQAAKLAVTPAVAALLMLGLLVLAPSMKGPVAGLMPNALPATIDAAGNAFFLFWAVLYGQIISGGMLQVCASSRS